MARIVRTAVAILALLSVAASPGFALDRAVFGQKIVLKRSSSGKEKLVVLLKDPALLFPTVGSADDPTTAAALVELFAGGGAESSFFLIPSGLGRPGWKIKERSGGDSYKFGNKEAPDGISEVRVALLREGRLLKIVAKRTGLSLAAPLGSVGVRIMTGSLRNCALFTGAAIQRDEAGQFKARKAPPPADCQDQTLSDLPSTPLCGDGIIGSPEECDGVGTCPIAGDECAVAGATAECTCCNGPCPETCGDGIVNGTEQCDGLDLSGCIDPIIQECAPAGGSGECTCCSDACPLAGGCCPGSGFFPGPGPCGGVCL